MSINENTAAHEHRSPSETEVIEEHSQHHPADQTTDEEHDHTVDLKQPSITQPESNSLELEVPVRRSPRVTTVPERYGYMTREDAPDENDNPSFEVAMNGPDRMLWKKAMDKEFEAFTNHSVGTLVDKPPDANVLGGMWIFSRERDKHHRIIKHKAQWVISGNHQIHDVDVFDTYASVGKSDSLRILLSIASKSGWDIL